MPSYVVKNAPADEKEGKNGKIKCQQKVEGGKTITGVGRGRGKEYKMG